MDGAELIVATLVLAAGTFAFRLAGPLLRTKVRLSPRAERLMTLSAVVLLA
ncbi:AzlD domain-containing protein, partial [Amycolatopsis sp. NPDC059090]